MSGINSNQCSRSPSIHSIAYNERLRRDLPERIPKLFLALGIEFENIEHIASGISNIAFGFTNISKGYHLQCILRVQIFEPDENISRQMIDSAAILRFLSTRNKTAAKVLYMDINGTNPLLRPYMIQHRLLGITFADAWEDMTLDDHTRVGQTVMDKLTELGDITFPHPGRLAALPDSDDICLRELQIFGQQLPLPGHLSRCTVEDWLSFLLDWQIQKLTPGHVDYSSYHQLKRVLQSMISRGYFANLNNIGDCVLSHGDLHAHNIIVSRDDNEIDDNDNDKKTPRAWKLAGFIDWDTTCSIPRILSHEPLEWLWADHLYEDEELLLLWTGHLDFVPDDKWNSMPEHMRELKRRIDHYASSVIPGYTEDAYGRGRWIRRVAKFAMAQISDNRESKMLQWMIAEWAKVEARDLYEIASSGC